MENNAEAVDIQQLNARIIQIVIKQQKLRYAIDEIVTGLESGKS